MQQQRDQKQSPPTTIACSSFDFSLQCSSDEEEDDLDSCVAMKTDNDSMRDWTDPTDDANNADEYTFRLPHHQPFGSSAYDSDYDSSCHSDDDDDNGLAHFGIIRVPQERMEEELHKQQLKTIDVKAIGPHIIGILHDANVNQVSNNDGHDEYDWNPFFYVGKVSYGRHVSNPDNVTDLVLSSLVQEQWSRCFLSRASYPIFTNALGRRITRTSSLGKSIEQRTSRFCLDLPNLFPHQVPTTCQDAYIAEQLAIDELSELLGASNATLGSEHEPI